MSSIVYTYNGIKEKIKQYKAIKKEPVFKSLKKIQSYVKETERMTQMLSEKQKKLMKYYTQLKELEEFKAREHELKQNIEKMQKELDIAESALNENILNQGVCPCCHSEIKENNIKHVKAFLEKQK